jgi:enterochelin esterase family protein
VGDCSVCYGPGYVTPDWATVRADTDPGQLVERQLYSPAQGRDNRITVYLPAGFETSMHYPLLVVHDGGDYLGYASMKIVLDNLIHDKKLAKIIVAFTYPGERSPNTPTILTVLDGSPASCCPTWKISFRCWAIQAVGA